jgi:hypothetical protein
MIVATLLGIGGLIYILLGALHAAYTWLDIRNPRRIVPDDPAVIEAMRHSKIRLTRGQSTIWQGWVGFNFSHSLGAIFFGTAVCFIATRLGVMSFPPWVLPVLAAVSGIYLLLAVNYWFRIPVLGTGIATACLALAWVLYAF